MPSVVSHEDHSNAFSNFTINEVVGKPFQVGSVNTGLYAMESIRVRRGHRDDSAKFHFKVNGEFFRNSFVAPNRFRYVLPDLRLVLSTHYLSSASTSRQNSSSVSARIRPVSISLSRRSTSASSSCSVISLPVRGTDASKDSARKTRCFNGKASSF